MFQQSETGDGAGVVLKFWPNLQAGSAYKKRVYSNVNSGEIRLVS